MKVERFGRLNCQHLANPVYKADRGSVLSKDLIVESSVKFNVAENSRTGKQCC